MTALAEAFRKQSWHCGALGSPFMEKWCLLMADRLEPDCAVARLLFDWQADPSHRASAVPLRFAGAFHALVLQGRDQGLIAAYPPNAYDPEAIWAAVRAAMDTHEDFILDWMQSPPQTNEVRRCNALIPAFHLIASETGLPLRTSEIGVSAGLNLNWDRLGMRIGDQVWGNAASQVQLTPEWRGPLPPLADVQVVDRAGCDLNPIDPSDPEQRLRLMSYLWADQADRMSRTDAAIELALSNPARIVQQDALSFLADRLANPQPGVAHVIYHSIVWQYLPAEAQAEGARMIAEAGAKSTADSPLFWLTFEGDNNGEGAGVVLRSWPDGRTRELARADFHGIWVAWNKVETLV